MIGGSPQRQTSFADYLELLKVQPLLLWTSGREIINIAREHGFALLQTVPLADLVRSPHPKLVNFVAKRLPGWQRALGSAGIF
jgi:hypothetical protein